MRFGKTGRAKRYLAQADRARDRGLWLDAARLYGKVIAIRPDWAGIHVQRGHAFKEMGNLDAAETAYRGALAVQGDNADAFLHLGHALKLQAKMDEAVVSYAAALAIDAGMQAAREELLHLGARDALPDGGTSGLRRAREFVGLHQSFESFARAADRWSREAPSPVVSYAEFYASYVVSPPPVTAESPMMMVSVDGRSGTPAHIRATLLSLLDQRHENWRAHVVCAASVADHPVGSLAAQDSRICFSSNMPNSANPDNDWVICTEAGARLDPECLAWFALALRSPGTFGAYADHDSVALDWRNEPPHFAPCFYPEFNRFFFEATDEPPLVVAVRRQLFDCLNATDNVAGEELRRAALLNAARHGAVVHIPLLLSSRGGAPISVFGGTDDLPPVSYRQRRLVPSDVGVTRSITVVIPTRDMADLLEACVGSLRQKANNAHRVEIVVVDNRSVESTTHTLLEEWQREGLVRTLSMDEPFNWSRANNCAAAKSSSDILCFLNNDTEMVSEGWDDLLDSALEEDVGVCGARLLYPDHTVQHAGVLFGCGQGSPIHEGVGAGEADGGPLHRWLTRRAVPAVTGAFLACTRSTFEMVGGFDEVTLPIGFNDIDFCMRVRTLGLAVLYDPALILVHHESKTRGLNDTIGKLLWDHGELESFSRRWRDAMFFDPGYNPHWSARGRPFDGLQRPSDRLVLERIARSESGKTWRMGPIE